MSRYTQQTVHLIANLTQDAIVRAVGDEREVLSLRAATNTFIGYDKDRKPKEHTEYHNLAIFSRKGAFDRLIKSDTLGKGAKVSFTGEIRVTKPFKTARGEWRSGVQVVGLTRRALGILIAKPMGQSKSDIEDEFPPAETFDDIDGD